MMALRGLTDQERVFVDAYAVTLDAKRAALEAGYVRPYPMGWRLITQQNYLPVQYAIADKLKEREEDSKLKAEYVREFIHDILELHPTDYFLLGPDGQWMIDPAAFSSLPHSVKRLVQDIEIRVHMGKPIFSVKFMSKTMALALAAKYTLTQKGDFTFRQDMPWDKIVEAASVGSKDEVEKIVESVEAMAHRLGTTTNGAA